MGAGVHHDVEPRGPGAGSGLLVDHAELQPHRADTEPVALVDRLVDDLADPAAVDEAVDDRDGRAVGLPAQVDLARDAREIDLGRERLVLTGRAKMSRWRKRLMMISFRTSSRNCAKS